MSDSAGAVTLTAPSVTKLAVTGGDGADSITINNISKDTTVTGGAGDDVVATSQTSLTQLDVASVDVETLKMTAATSTVNLKDATIGAIDYSIGSGTSTLSGVASGFDVAVKAASTSLGVTLSDATGTEDSLDLALGKSGTSGTDGIAAGTLTATGIETVNISSVGDVKTTGLIDGSGVNTLTIAGNSVKTIDVDGERDFTLTQSGGSIETYDASDSTGTQNTSNIVFKSTGATVKGGSDKDTLTATASADTIHGNGGVDTITGGAGNDTIDGGDGADKITGGTGGDTITGGAGADVFTVADGDSITNYVDTYKDFTTGEDRFVLGQSVTKFAGNVATVADGVEAMTGDNQAFFVTATNTLYIIASKSTAYQAGSDDILKLEGVSALVESDLGLGSQGAGNSITLIAASAEVSKTASTNASAKTTDKDDTITTSFANLSSTTIDGALGEDTLTMTTAITGSTDISGVTTSIETLNLATDGTTSNDVAGVEASTVTLGANGDTVAMASGVTNLTLTGGAKADIITASAIKGSIVTGAGSDDVTLEGTDSYDTLTIDLGADGDTLTLTEAGTIDVASGKLLTIKGGTGTDILELTGNAATIDLSATNLLMSSLETLKGDTDDQFVTMGQTEFAMFSTIDLGVSDADSKITFDEAGTYDLTAITYSNGADTKLAATADNVIIKAAKADLTDTSKGTEGVDNFIDGNGSDKGGKVVITDSTAIDITGAGTKGGITDVETLEFQNAKVTMLKASLFDGTVSSDDGFKTITGSGGASSEIQVEGGATTVDFSNTVVTGVTKYDIIQAAGTDTTLKFDAADLAGTTSVKINDGGGTAEDDLNLVIADSGDISSVVWSKEDNVFDSIAFNTGNVASSTLTLDASIASVLHSTVAIDGNGGNTTVNDGALVIKSASDDTAVDFSVPTVTDVASITFVDAAGGQNYSIGTSDAARAISKVELAGGSDTITIVNAATATSSGNDAAVVITGFDAGSVGGADKIALTHGSTAATTFNSLAAGSQTDIDSYTDVVTINEITRGIG
jgi:hypothetical protein